MLELQDISFKRDGKHILDHVSFKFEAEKFYVITGPNGSGKSTLAKIIMGIEQPDSGKILLDGKDITHKKIDERSRLGIGFAFQQPVQFKGITVYDLYKAQRDATEYLNEHRDEFNDEEGNYDSSKFMDYRLEQMQKTTDTVEYTITFNLTKDDDDNWQITELSQEDLEKIHGIYNYDSE